jgi:hypothetical protein
MGVKDYRVPGLSQWLALLPGCGEFPRHIPLGAEELYPVCYATEDLGIVEL